MSASLQLQVPTGSVLMCEKYRGSEIHTTLKGVVKVHIEGDLGYADLYTADAACVFLSESDVINISPSMQGRLTALSKCHCTGIVFAECTAMSRQYFGSLQETATLQLNLVTIPVLSQADAAQHIIQMVKQQCRPDGGSLLLPQTPAMDNALLLAVQALPKTGSVKAKALLSNFESIKKISEASVKDLSAVVGHASAEAIHTYFHRPVTGTDTAK